MTDYHNHMIDFPKYMEAFNVYNPDKRVIEHRFLHGFRGIASGYFNDPEKAYNAVGKYWRDYTCYITLQGLNEDIMARNPNRLRIGTHMTSDGDVKYYLFIHIDIDPVRPSGIQATDEEAKGAYKRAKEVIDFLHTTASFPKPIVVFSGNGTTLDYRFESPMPTSKENIDLMKSFLETLAMLFSDNVADIDRKVYNPGRIIKLPGTISAKGTNTKDRPYRYSKIIETGDMNKGITISQLQEIASIGKEIK